MPLTDEFWCSDEPPMTIEEIDLSLIDRILIPEGIRLRPNTQTHLRFEVDAKGYPVAFQKEMSCTRNSGTTEVKTYQRWCLVCISYDPSGDLPARVGFFLLSESAYKDLLYLHSNFSVESHDVHVQRAPGQFGKHLFTPVLNRYTNSLGLAQLQNLAARIEAGEQF